jgi:hypothetical protein
LNHLVLYSVVHQTDFTQRAIHDKKKLKKKRKKLVSADVEEHDRAKIGPKLADSIQGQTKVTQLPLYRDLLECPLEDGRTTETCSG